MNYSEYEERKRLKEIAIVGAIIFACWYWINFCFVSSRKMLKTLPWYYIGVPNFWKKIGAPYPSKIPTWLDGLIILFWVFCLFMMDFDFNEDGQLESEASFASILFFFFTISLSYFMFSFITKAFFENKKINKYWFDVEEFNVFCELSKKKENRETLTEKEDKFYRAYVESSQK